jgi:hypothetical protein
MAGEGDGFYWGYYPAAIQTVFMGADPPLPRCKMTAADEWLRTTTLRSRSFVGCRTGSIVRQKK